MTTKLARIAELSAQNPNMVFTSIAHMINVELLRECHNKMDGLSLEEEKSRLIEFGRFVSDNCAKRGTKPQTFDFLGFTHYCSKSRDGRFRVKRKTSKKKVSKKLKEIHQRIGKMRSMKIKDIVKKLNEILIGYYHYYGITDNLRYVRNFKYEVLKSLYYWLNRRGGRRKLAWNNFWTMINSYYSIAKPKVYVSIYAQ